METGRLVLSLREGEAVQVGDNIEVYVNKAGSRIELVFTLPKDIKVLRVKESGEVYTQRGYSHLKAYT